MTRPSGHDARQDACAPPIQWARPIQMLALCVSLLFAAAFEAQAHRQNESYVYFTVSDEALSGRVEVTLGDLARAFPDAADSAAEKQAVLDASETIYAYFADRLHLEHDGTRHPIEPTGITFLDTEIGTFAQLNFEVPTLRPVPEAIGISYDFLFSDVDPGHLGFALIENNTRTGLRNNESHIALTFRPGGEMQELSLVGEPPLKVFIGFIEHGILHIWLGFDHVLFLITLLLTSVMVREQGRWVPNDGLRESLWNVVRIVTVFTIAHTITLGLATFGVVRLPVMFVEAVIAASIAVVALGNLVPALHAQNWIVIFIFGLFHGFGFANVLRPLGIDPTQKAIGLAAFNIGVEIGQLAIVLVVFPLLFLIRKWSLYRFFALQLGSVAIIGVAGFWFVERTFDLLGPVRSRVRGWFV